MSVKSRFIEWEPGNCTRYACVLATVKDRQGEPCVLLSWLKNGDAGGPSILLRPWSTVSLGYLMEKMGVNEADGAALLALLERKCGVNVYMPVGYDANGCRK